MDNAALLLKYIATTLLLFIVTVGWGEWLLRVFRTPYRGRSSFLDRVWLGVVAITLVLQVWHLFLPVGLLAALFIALSGICGTAMFFRCMDGPVWTSRALASVVLVGLVSLPVYISLPGVPEVYDSGMYHFQGIRWANEYPVIPGLAHLNIQLAANQVSFLWCALLNVPGLQPFGYTYLNAFLILAAAAYPMSMLASGLLGRTVPTTADIFHLFSLPVYAVLSVSMYAESPSPDFMSWIVAVVLFGRVAVILAPYARDGRSLRARCLLPVALATVIIMIKFSTVFYAMLAYGAVGALLLGGAMRKRFPVRTIIRDVFPVAVLAALMLGVWTVRGIVQTGYLLYPVSATRLNLDWSLSKHTVDVTRWYIGVWGHVSKNTSHYVRRQCASYFETALGAPDEAVAEPPPVIPYFTEDEWLKDWAYAVSCNPVVQHAVLIALASLLATVLLGYGCNRRIRERRWLLGFPIIAAGGAFCCLTAPALRFLLPYILLAVPWSLAWLWSQLPVTVRHSTIIPGALALAAACVTWQPDMSEALMESGMWAKQLSIPDVEIEEKRTDSGLMLRLPGKWKWVYNAALPATPYFNPRLSLRVPAKGLRSGFTLGDDGVEVLHAIRD